MCNLCEATVDEKMLNDMIKYYSMLMVRKPKMTISESETRDTISKLFHGEAEHAQSWLSGEKSIGKFIETLYSLR